MTINLRGTLDHQPTSDPHPLRFSPYSYKGPRLHVHCSGSFLWHAVLIKGLRNVLRAIITLGTPPAALVLDISHDCSSTTQFTQGQARLDLIFSFLLLNSHELDCSTQSAS